MYPQTVWMTWNEWNETITFVKINTSKWTKKVSCHHCTTHIYTVTHSPRVIFSPSFYFVVLCPRTVSIVQHFIILCIMHSIRRSKKQFTGHQNGSFFFPVLPLTIWWFGLKDNVLYLSFVRRFRKSNRERSGDFDSKKPWICFDLFQKSVNFVCACAYSNRNIEFGVRFLVSPNNQHMIYFKQCRLCFFVFCFSPFHRKYITFF